MAWRDRDWLLDGATVHVSFVGFDNGTEHHRMLDNAPVNAINADLTSEADLTKEPLDSPLLLAIAAAARYLVTKRDDWLRPPGASAEQLRKRTLTNLYNDNPTWLQEAHRELDEAVFAAYGWPKNLADQDILTRLLQLNEQRYSQHHSPVLIGQ